MSDKRDEAVQALMVNLGHVADIGIGMMPADVQQRVGVLLNNSTGRLRFAIDTYPLCITCEFVDQEGAAVNLFTFDARNEH